MVLKLTDTDLSQYVVINEDLEGIEKDRCESLTTWIKAKQIDF